MLERVVYLSYVVVVFKSSSWDVLWFGLVTRVLGAQRFSFEVMDYY